jgi:hypothetical protein
MHKTTVRFATFQKQSVGRVTAVGVATHYGLYGTWI